MAVRNKVPYLITHASDEKTKLILVNKVQVD